MPSSAYRSITSIHLGGSYPDDDPLSLLISSSSVRGMGDEGPKWDTIVEGQAMIDGEMESIYPAIMSCGSSPVWWGSRRGLEITLSVSHAPIVNDAEDCKGSFPGQDPWLTKLWSTEGRTQRLVYFLPVTVTVDSPTTCMFLRGQLDLSSGRKHWRLGRLVMDGKEGVDDHKRAVCGPPHKMVCARGMSRIGREERCRLPLFPALRISSSPTSVSFHLTIAAITSLDSTRV